MNLPWWGSLLVLIADAECQPAGPLTCTVAAQVWYPALSSIPSLSKHNVLFAPKQCVNGVTTHFSINTFTVPRHWDITLIFDMAYWYNVPLTMQYKLVHINLCLRTTIDCGISAATCD